MRYDNNLSPYFLRRFVISENDEEVKAFTEEKDAAVWMNENDGVYSMEEKYYESNSSVRKDAVATYEQGTVFPRMYSGDNQNHIQGYQKWSGYDPSDGTDSEIGRDGKRLPSFIENLSYFFLSLQLELDSVQGVPYHIRLSMSLKHVCRA